MSSDGAIMVAQLIWRTLLHVYKTVAFPMISKNGGQSDQFVRT